MPLADADAAAREAAAPVPMLERAPHGGGNRPGPGPDLQQAPLRVVTHHHPAGIARQAAGRLRGNARAVLEDRLPRLIRIGQRRGVDVDHHLVALARGAGIEPLMVPPHRALERPCGPLGRHLLRAAAASPPAPAETVKRKNAGYRRPGVPRRNPLMDERRQRLATDWPHTTAREF